MTGVGSVYGEALYTLAREENLSQVILQQLKVLDSCFAAEPDFIRLLGAPNLPKAERCQILDDSFRGKIELYLLNFLKILTEKGYMRHFSDCCNAYQEQYRKDNGILLVEAVTAVPLRPEQAQLLTKKLEGITGKTIQLQERIDPAVVGGMRLDYDGKRLDDTVANRLSSLRALLKDTTL